MQFLDWLDRHFASNCHYYYADDLGCPLDLFPDPSGPGVGTQAGGQPVEPAPQAGTSDRPPTAKAWQ